MDVTTGFKTIIREEITWSDWEKLSIDIEQEFQKLYSMIDDDDGYEEFMESMIVKEGECVSIYNCSTKESWHWDGLSNE